MYGYKYTRKHTAEVAAHWLSDDMRRTTTFIWKPRKKPYIGGSWCIVGADNKLHGFDREYFYECLGIEVSKEDNPCLSASLKRAGYRVHDEGIAVTVIFDN